jgi:hypothetical protein
LEVVAHDVDQRSPIMKSTRTHRFAKCDRAKAHQLRKPAKRSVTYAER